MPEGIGILKRHIDHVHEGRRDYKCVQCGKDFCTSYDLKRHIKCVHEKDTSLLPNERHEIAPE